VNIPLVGHFKLSKAQAPITEDGKAPISEVPYASTVSSLMYDMVCTRPDIAQIVGAVSRYMRNPRRSFREQ